MDLIKLELHRIAIKSDAGSDKNIVPTLFELGLEQRKGTRIYVTRFAVE